MVGYHVCKTSFLPEISCLIRFNLSEFGLEIKFFIGLYHKTHIFKLWGKNLSNSFIIYYFYTIFFVHSFVIPYG